jgi:hypothetical protein
LDPEEPSTTAQETKLGQLEEAFEDAGVLPVTEERPTKAGALDSTLGSEFDGISSKYKQQAAEETFSPVHPRQTPVHPNLTIRF